MYDQASNNRLTPVVYFIIFIHSIFCQCSKQQASDSDMETITHIIETTESMSNMDNNNGEFNESLFQANEAAQLRLSCGYGADGACGGVYSEHNPPEGKIFKGYLKGYTGIVWEDVESAATATTVTTNFLKSCSIS